MGCMDWIDVAQDRGQLKALANTNEPSGSIKVLGFLE
jgi:hypothetical protein